MRVKRIFSQVLAGTILLLFTTFVAACGSSSAAAGTTTTVTATATATNCLSQTTGTIHSINGTTLLVTSLQGKDVQVTLTSTTTFIRQATLTPAGLKEGMLVSVLVTQNTDNTYSARTVNVRSSLTRQGGFTGSLRLCNGQRFRGTGTPGAFSGPGFGSGTPGSVTGQSRQTINGTVSQVNANSLTVTDASGNDFTVTLTTTTRISTQQTVTASDLHSGVAVTIIGSANSQGVINASSVSILQALPNRRATPTPTPGT